MKLPIGILYCVATPIGNLADITQRAVQILGGVDRILAEDTRVTGRLLQHLGIQKPLLSLHDFNESQRVGQVLAALQVGESLALVSDAGTPLISDPGYKLVREVTKGGFKVVPIPGVSAVITALSVAGLPTDRFAFEGFLPAKGSGRRKVLQALLQDERTLVFYESCHRLVESLADLCAVLGEAREAVIGRELTKLYEHFYHGTLAELYAKAQQDPDMSRGEIVMMVAGAKPVEEAELSVETLQVLQVLLSELPAKQAASLAARLTGKAKNTLYKQAVAMQQATR